MWQLPHLVKPLETLTEKKEKGLAQESTLHVHVECLWESSGQAQLMP